MSSYRYRVGCAGMFMLGMDFGCEDEDEAVAYCGSPSAPAGCEVFDTLTGKWIGPCWEEVEVAQERLAVRRVLTEMWR